MTHFKLAGMIELIEIGFDSHSLLETLLEETLESDNLLDVAKQSVDLCRRQESLLLQWLQIVF